MNMRQQALSRRITGDTHWKLCELTQLAEILDMPIADLIGEAVA